MTQGELAEAIYGDSFHTPNIYSALMGLVNEKVIMRLDGYPCKVLYLWNISYSTDCKARLR